jgi:hypothetical protein
VKKSFFLAVIVCLCLNASAQYRKESIYGARFGGSYSRINDLETTILSESFFSSYTLEPEERFGFMGGGFFNYRPTDFPHLGIQAEVFFSQINSDLLFDNKLTHFNYRMQFKYRYMDIAGLLKLYPGNYGDALEGFSFSAGLQIGLSLTPDNIVYTSGGSGRLDVFGSDLEQQQQLRNVLKGKTNAGAVIGIAYEVPHAPLVFDLRYFHGLSDVVETQANSYNFIENKNNVQSLQFTIGFYLPRNF